MAQGTQSGFALSKWFLCPSPAGHKGREHTGKNYHQQTNNAKKTSRFPVLP
jgi:hypothetical protein